MKRRALLVGLCTVLLAIAVVGGIAIARMYFHSIPKPVVANAVSKKPQLIFSDEFNSTALDTSKWNTCYDSYSTEYKGCTNYGNDESEWYTKSQVSTIDGNLVLSAHKELTPGLDKNGKPKNYEYNSGMVTTGRYISSVPAKWSHSYGYYEAKIKTPSGQGVWPAFWLLPIDHDWPPEIDIMEILGNKPNDVLATYHWKGEEGKGTPQDSTTYSGDSNFNSQWHVYSVNWKPGVIDWYIDGNLVKHFQNDAVSGKPMQIILNLAVGGTLPGDPDASTPNNLQMLVDYVRVYEG